MVSCAKMAQLIETPFGLWIMYYMAVQRAPCVQKTGQFIGERTCSVYCYDDHRSRIRILRIFFHF